MGLDREVSRFLEDPTAYFGFSGPAALRMPVKDLEALQLAALRQRFAEMRQAITVLKTMSDEQGLAEIVQLDDVVPVLFAHTVYKSYPVSLLEKSRFDQLTRWLNKLSATDLSSVPIAACNSIDSWMDTLSAHTDLVPVHSSGTSGTISFLPRTNSDWEKFFRAIRMALFEFGDPAGTRNHDDEYFDVIWPSFRSGRSTHYRAANYQMRFLAGSEERFHAMNPHDVSADVMWLAGRIRNAAARGELHTIDVSPQLRARRDEFEAVQRSLQDGMSTFLGDMVETLKGKRILMLGTSNIHYQMARMGLDRGQSGVFAPDSVIISGGGGKGIVLPDDWIDSVRKFIGVDRILYTYGMSEMLAINLCCEHDRIHFYPWIIPFLLDPDSGELLPRLGERTGRFAFVDLMTTSMWGGFVTGDEVSVDWSPCPCGRTTPHASKTIGRFSEKRGGDDKISCAAQPEAHEAALDFLLADGSP